MFEQLLILALAVIGGPALIFLLLRPRALCVVKVKGGVAKLAKGRAPRGFLESCQQIADDCKAAEGKVRIVSRRGGVSFLFSRGIPKRSRQRIRNAWHCHI